MPARPSREDADRREAELHWLAAQLADKERLLREKDTMIADLRQAGIEVYEVGWTG